MAKNLRRANASGMILVNSHDEPLWATGDGVVDDFVVVGVNQSVGQALETFSEELWDVSVSIRAPGSDDESDDSPRSKSNDPKFINARSFIVICVAFGLVIALAL